MVIIRVRGTQELQTRTHLHKSRILVDIHLQRHLDNVDTHRHTQTHAHNLNILTNTYTDVHTHIHVHTCTHTHLIQIRI